MTKILVVEDNDELGQLLVERLERRGHIVLLAADGESAFSSAITARPDVILLESQLRGDSEWTAARKLKLDDHTREIPIIALMASSSDEARTQALQNGAQELHAKPVDFSKLCQQIDAVVGVEEVPAETDVEKGAP